MRHRMIDPLAFGASPALVVLFVLLSCSGFAQRGSNLGGYARNFVPANLSGQVTDGSGNPVSGALVSTIAGHFTTTDISGNYTLFLDAPGFYTVSAKSGTSVATDTVEVSLGLSTTLNISFGGTKVGVVRNGGWFLDFNGNGQFDDCTTDRCIGFGLAADVPVTGDWNGSGTTKIGVFRNGAWVLDFNGNEQFDDCTTDQCIGFGLTGDEAISGSW